MAALGFAPINCLLPMAKVGAVVGAQVGGAVVAPDPGVLIRLPPLCRKAQGGYLCRGLLRNLDVQLNFEHLLKGLHPGLGRIRHCFVASDTLQGYLMGIQYQNALF